MQDFNSWFEENEERIKQILGDELNRNPTAAEILKEAESEYNWSVIEGWGGSDRNDE